MRRFLAAGVSALLLVATLATPAAAGGPTHTKGWTTFDMTFDPGVLCTFPVRWVEDGSRMDVLTFPVQRNGDLVVIAYGPQWSTVTDITSGASMIVGGPTLQTFVTHADKTLDVWIDGTVVVGYLYPTDSPGPSLSWALGHTHDTLDAGQNTVTHSFKGKVVDLCAALAAK